MSLHSKEKELLKYLQLFPEKIQEAADSYSPALIANYTYELVKEHPAFRFEERGKIDVKGKGEIPMFFVSLNQGWIEIAN